MMEARRTLACCLFMYLSIYLYLLQSCWQLARMFVSHLFFLDNDIGRCDEDVPSAPVLWVDLEMVSFYVRSFALMHHRNASVAGSCFLSEVLLD